MSDEELAILEGLARAASQAPWWWLQTPTRTVNAAVRWVAKAIRKSEAPALWGVAIGEPDEHTVIAFTGNGTMSEANSAYLVAAQPQNVLLLIAEIRALRDRLEGTL